MIALVIGFLILSLALHEYGHAWMAYKCGDDTAARMGRLTLNPIAHIDLYWTIILPLILYFALGFAFGGAKPVPVVASNLRHPTRDMAFVALAGPAMNILLAILFMLGLKVALYVGDYEVSAILPQVLKLSVIINVALALFNMIPIPPLDGSRVLSYLLPSSLRQGYDQIERFGMLIIVLLIWGGGLWPLIHGALADVVDLINWGTGGAWS